MGFLEFVRIIACFPGAIFFIIVACVLGELLWKNKDARIVLGLPVLSGAVIAAAWEGYPHFPALTELLRHIDTAQGRLVFFGGVALALLGLRHFIQSVWELLETDVKLGHILWMIVAVCTASIAIMYAPVVGAWVMVSYGYVLPVAGVVLIVITILAPKTQVDAKSNDAKGPPAAG
jgi:hypothetical protein